MSREEIFVTVGGSIIVALVGAMAALLGKKQDMTGKAQTALNQSFERYVATTDKRLEQLEKAVREKDEKISLLESVVRDLKFHMKSLENLLAQHGIPIPMRPFKLREPPAVENLYTVDKGEIREFED